LRYENSIGLLRKLCEIFGIDPDKTPVSRITIDVPAEGVAKIEVHRYMQADQSQKLIAALGLSSKAQVTIGRRIDLSQFDSGLLPDEPIAATNGEGFGQWRT
jgi:hypothetical protein